MEARAESLPLYERIKFLAIYSSNLDEFYRVRVASIRSLLKVKKKSIKEMGLDPQTILDQINSEVERQQEEFGMIFREKILPELHSHGIHLLRDMPDHPQHREYIDHLFREEILPYLHPELLAKNKILHFLRDKALYLVIKMRRRTDKGEEDANFVKRKRPKYALVQIPTHYFPRFVRLPSPQDKEHYVMFLDDIIRFHLDILFPGYLVEGAFSVKLSRDADLLIEDEFRGDLVNRIQRSLNKRQVGAPARFLYDKSLPKSAIKYLRDTFNLGKKDLVAGGRYHNFFDFFSFPNPLSPALEGSSLPPLKPRALMEGVSIFEEIAKEDIILHFPYHSYDPVLRFFNEAAIDPAVTEIRTTQYRVASDSAIVNALISAARNSKKVTVFVEIKARFDEASNLKSAEGMKAAGVEVIYSMPDIKVHAKVAQVIRQEGESAQRYAFLSTGNFNEKTARIYADHGFFTHDPTLTQELDILFDRLKANQIAPAGQEEPGIFHHLLVARFNLRSQLNAMIQQEIEQAKAGQPAYLIVKINNLEDQQMINKLYEASQAGVVIDLIIRGICCLVPGVQGVSENIRITRIVGTFLEHARVYLFYQNGNHAMYLGSADWMDRNLNRRIEVVFPVKHPDHKAEIMEILRLQLEDNTQGVTIDTQLNNVPKTAPAEGGPVNAQMDTYKKLEDGTLGKQILQGVPRMHPQE